MIRAKLFAGLCDGRITLRTLFDDEKLKLSEEPYCSYCGARDRLVVDHLIARHVGGKDDGANLVRACVSCNSSKQEEDVIEWLLSRRSFPSVLLYRRYLKVVNGLVADAGLLDCPLDDPRVVELPFDIAALPADLPALVTLRLTAA